MMIQDIFLCYLKLSLPPIHSVSAKILVWGLLWLKCPELGVKRCISIVLAAPCVHWLLYYWDRTLRN